MPGVARGERGHFTPGLPAGDPGGAGDGEGRLLQEMQVLARLCQESAAA